jgi:hypothetical protein
MTKKKVSQKIEFLHVGNLVGKGSSDGQCGGAVAMAFDSQGDWYQLEGSDPNWRLQKFGPDMGFRGSYKPKKREEVIQGGAGLACDPSGRLFVLQQNGRILVFGPNFKLSSRLESHLADCIDLDTDSKGDLYVLDRAEQQVNVLDPAGKPLFKFGKPGTTKNALASPMRLRLDGEDNVYVLESVNSQLRVRVFDKTGIYQRDFIVELSSTPYSSLGIDNAGHLFVNDSAGDTGVRVYSLKGDYLGSSKSSTDNQMYPNQGFLTASRWSGDVVINYASAVAKFQYKPKP